MILVSFLAFNFKIKSRLMHTYTNQVCNHYIGLIKFYDRARYNV
jgi:hypothetical protein